MRWTVAGAGAITAPRCHDASTSGKPSATHRTTRQAPPNQATPKTISITYKIDAYPVARDHCRPPSGAPRPHSGYFLATVAGAFIVSIGLSPAAGYGMMLPEPPHLAER